MKHLLLILFTLSSLFSTATIKRNSPVDTTQVINGSLLYKISQEDNYVHLNISTKDKMSAMSILKNGLTIYYDLDGKKQKDVSIKYPNNNTIRQFQEGNILNVANDIDLNSIIEQLPAEAEYGYHDIKRTFNKDFNGFDIFIDLIYNDSNQLFEFSVTIPKDKISSQDNTDFSKLSIGVVANGMVRGGERDEGQAQSRGGRSGGGRGNGGGSGGRSGGGRGGNDRQNGQGQSSTDAKSPSAFWFNVNN
ncbi:hypothetical protein [Frigoriflavimonas asaccharolytica]|uniref:Putative membrane protein YgcG n=1 Tax=Frigoriflavimonas asaccharolytica TaxID=2735899 RepID=A0A8J8KBI0_9FLAO|nr:hypothetical protein [Frigoriflavimonas asaccharolytica]NRS92599.1 putative membrane protein YgcG [Frigoriflavimonas asaccharolytica]